MANYQKKSFMAGLSTTQKTFLVLGVIIALLIVILPMVRRKPVTPEALLAFAEAQPDTVNVADTTISYASLANEGRTKNPNFMVWFDFITGKTPLPPNPADYVTKIVPAIREDFNVWARRPWPSLSYQSLPLKQTS